MLAEIVDAEVSAVDFVGGEGLLGDIQPGRRGDHRDQRYAHRDQDQSPLPGIGDRFVVGVRIDRIEQLDIDGFVGRGHGAMPVW